MRRASSCCQRVSRDTCLDADVSILLGSSKQHRASTNQVVTGDLLVDRRRGHVGLCAAGA